MNGSFFEYVRELHEFRLAKLSLRVLTTDCVAEQRALPLGGRHNKRHAPCPLSCPPPPRSPLGPGARKSEPTRDRDGSGSGGTGI
eukprot:2427704-Prymnesium_polylepis.1